ncbi:hypothetical protein Zmor_018615 [Zophobas morio]|uniref:Uncharacterized protein n=1 Tax=Zophobas morio TaxID=2755281 RepID=A0AA38MD87_9CUCU|nr:hypothetical protein Zmor_018615 [Zophobas morio]
MSLLTIPQTFFGTICIHASIHHENPGAELSENGTKHFAERKKKDEHLESNSASKSDTSQPLESIDWRWLERIILSFTFGFSGASTSTYLLVLVIVIVIVAFWVMRTHWSHVDRQLNRRPITVI